MEIMTVIIIDAVLLGILGGFFLGYYVRGKHERNRDRNMKKWELTRSKGQAHFILVWGIVYWGGLMGIMNFILLELLDPSHLWMLHLVLNMTLFPMGGILWGWLSWRSIEKKYNEWLIERSFHEDPLLF